ncbi:MAG: sugar phosphate isomerase/epimerase [Acidobacteria bacterium]|nr:sugar phosphate isomerase/epimerase [Acidobacteriota bacterium]
MDRRTLFGLGAVIPSLGFAQNRGEKKFKISLAEWSLHKAIQSRLMTNLDFPRIAQEQFGIEGLEFVNGLWEAPTSDYVRRLKRNIAATGTKAVLIMCDGEGFMGHTEKSQRMAAADNHRKWVDIAAELGGHAIRTNMYPGEKQPATAAEIDDFIGRCVESFSKLCEYAAGRNISVIIENHGGISSNPDVVVKLMQQAKQPNLGTLPDFGNFPKDIDRYEAVKKLMAYARGVSFKCFDFDANLKETTMDMDRLMGIVDAAGYHGWVGIEYEGSRMTEFEGIQAGKRYLDKWIG